MSSVSSVLLSLVPGSSLSAPLRTAFMWVHSARFPWPHSRYRSLAPAPAVPSSAPGPLDGSLWLSLAFSFVWASFHAAPDSRPRSLDAVPVVLMAAPLGLSSAFFCCVSLDRPLVFLVLMFGLFWLCPSHLVSPCSGVISSRVPGRVLSAPLHADPMCVVVATTALFLALICCTSLSLPLTCLFFRIRDPMNCKLLN